MAGLPLLPAGSDPQSPALADDQGGRWISHGQLRDRALGWRARLGPRPGLTVLIADNTIETVAALVGALAAGRAVALVSARLPDAALGRLVAAYLPDEIVSGPDLRPGPGGPAPHPDLALLLSTSGSTGSAKMVRLSRSAVEANAAAIAQVQALGPDDVACGHLPLDYSYGLSVLTSHLAVGARVALTGQGFMDRGFWSRMAEAGITHLPGVPFHHRMLDRLGLDRLKIPTLATLTQAGGRLDLDVQSRAHAAMEARGGRFLVMYGQTEAAPRMTTLAHHDFPAHGGSVGRALPGGRIEITDGEVIYHGPNVMMGYAEGRADVARGDDLGGRLATGDLGVLDGDGFLTLTGRRSRIAKVVGLRLNLDEIEAAAQSLSGQAVAAVEGADCVRLVCEGDCTGLAAALADRFALPSHVWSVECVAQLPRLPGGKPDYQALAR